jgi:hypothetical protein
MKLAILSSLLTATVATTADNKWHMTKDNTADGVCSIFDGELPDFCTCKDMTLGGILNCTLSLGIASYHIDTVGVVASVLPCGTPASASIVIYEQIIYPNGYPLAKFTTGTTYHVPVPELNYGIDEGPIKVGR